jgi:hypothetical protein
MHHGFALRYIPQVMGWTSGRENTETTWLRLISEWKYDSYQDFLAGSRFVEALLDWLQQFAPEDRELAYSLVRNRLIFISLAEMRHLVQRTFPAFIRPVLGRRTAANLGVPNYLVWSTPTHQKAVSDILKKSLFVGLSDGARLDAFRRANVGRISNEQIVLQYEIGGEKWEDVHKELRKRTDETDARFQVVVLLDDFAGSGKTLLRYDDEKAAWAGKLIKVSRILQERAEMFSPDCTLLVHHYVGTVDAEQAIEENLRQAKEAGALLKFDVQISFDLCLSRDVMLRRGTSADIDNFCDRYYDEQIMTKSLRVGGQHVTHGFAGCGLTLVMEHNTPNNSLGILWAESAPQNFAKHQMRALFRRRQRHF